MSALLALLGRVSPYELLGIDDDADAQTIRGAHRALLDELRAKRASSSEPAVHRMIDIVMCGLVEAYESISTPQRRRAYDAQRGR